MARSGLPPERLELEITEAAMLANTADTLAVLSRLRSLGVVPDVQHRDPVLSDLLLEVPCGKTGETCQLGAELGPLSRR